jgi:tRNA A-37 threonylcarbamoyl transferase component Bud32
MLPQPDHGPKGYVPRIKYPEHLSGFESRELPDIGAFYTHIKSTCDSIPKKHDFLRKIDKFEGLLEEEIGADQKISATEQMKSVGFTDQDIKVMDELSMQIQGDIKNGVLAKRESTLNYILENALHIKHSQVDYFSSIHEDFNKYGPFSIIRMLTELELLGDVSGLTFFNGEGAIPIYDKKIILEPNQRMPTKITTPPKASTLRFENDESKPTPLYLMEKSEMPNGHGGLSKVHKAWDTKFERIVCVKELKDPYLHQKDFNDFIEVEAKTMARLRHPGVPQVYDILSENGNKYMVMEYIEGDNVYSRIENSTNGKEPLSQENIIDIIDQTASIIDYLADFTQIEMTELGKKETHYPLFHLDIKPNNLIISPDSKRVSLFDFNMSNWVTRSLRARRDTPMGTLAYIAPEILDESDMFSLKTEVYSLAVTAYNLLTGQIPFVGPELDDIHMQISTGKHSHLNECTSLKLPLELANINNLNAVINKGMNINPDERYNTAQEFADAFKNALLGIPNTEEQAK